MNKTTNSAKTLRNRYGIPPHSTQTQFDTQLIVPLHTGVTAHVDT